MPDQEAEEALGWRRQFVGRIAYRIFMALPNAGWFPLHWFFWLLPAAGNYAYADDLAALLKEQSK